MKTLLIVIPCYNEEEVLAETTRQLNAKLDTLVNVKISGRSQVLYVNDGSKDRTWELILQICAENPRFTGISLSRNRGHQNALMAGLDVARRHGDIIISMDADLQDDINAIDEMIERSAEGFDIVYGVRKKREKDTFFKRITAESFYKLMNFFGADVVYNHADYRLTSQRVLDELFQFQEVNLFLRGIFPLIGFRHTIVYYDRNERFAGTSKYPLKKMLAFAWDGITSFSVKPIKLILNIGILVLLFSFLVILYSIIMKFTGYTVDGWTFIVCSIWLVSGVQMISIGLIGEYIGKIYSETKHRPRYIIDKNLMEDNKQRP